MCRTSMKDRSKTKILTKLLKEKFNSNIEIIDKTNAYFEGLKKSYYRDDINKKLEYH